MSIFHKVFAIALTAAALTACDDASAVDEFAGDVEFRPWDGPRWNNSYLGAHRLDHSDTDFTWYDGNKLDAVYLKHPDYGWVKLDEVWGEEGELKGRTNKPLIEFSGAQFLHSLWYMQLEDPVIGKIPFTMRIDKYKFQDDLHFYTIVHQPTGGGNKEWATNCDPDEKGSIDTIILEDTEIDYSTGDFKERKHTLYWACTAGAAAKGTLWGFNQWDYGREIAEVGARVVRADICADGGSFTKTGTELQLEDQLGLNVFPNPGAKTEAIWPKEGPALCFDFPRNPAFKPEDVLCNGVAPPSCNGYSFDKWEDGLVHTKLP
ncbi:MAG: hypothetical protein KC417_04120 [Myxococcales bacterium]|nr:hypothetical protein [Myxococcales bacterium]MCA9694757.1 hypothetical protein [Myxococcales bacterium]